MLISNNPFLFQMDTTLCYPSCTCTSILYRRSSSFENKSMLAHISAHLSGSYVDRRGSAEVFGAMLAVKYILQNLFVAFTRMLSSPCVSPATSRLASVVRKILHLLKVVPSSSARCRTPKTAQSLILSVLSQVISTLNCSPFAVWFPE